MPKQLFYITAFETRHVTRGYNAENEAEAVERMSEWMKKQEAEHGREFTGTVRVEPASK